MAFVILTSPSDASSGGRPVFHFTWSPSPEQLVFWSVPSPKGFPPSTPVVSLKVALPAKAQEASLRVASAYWRVAPPGDWVPGTCEAAVLGQRGVWHGVPYQEIIVHPVRRSPSGGVQVLSALEGTLEVPGLAASLDPPLPSGISPWASASLFLNPTGALAFRHASEMSRESSPSGASTFPPSASPVRVDVVQDGIYRLDYTYLTSHGLSPGTQVETIHLTCRGVEIPIWIEGPSSGPLSPSSAVVFYGQKLAITNRPMFDGGDFSDTNVYWLYSDGLRGLRMATAPAAPTGRFPSAAQFTASVHLEVNTYLDSLDHFRPNGDNWFWAPILAAPAGSSTSRDFTVNLPHPYGEGLSATAILAGLNDGQHEITLALNGVPSSAAPDPGPWQGKALSAQTCSFSSGLASGTNTVTLTLPGAGGQPDFQLLDYFDFTYSRTLDSDSGTLLITDVEASAQYACPGHGTAPYILDLSASDPATGLKRPILLTGATFSAGTATFEMPANPSVTRRLVALSSAPLLPSAAYVAAAPAIPDPANPADMVIITHPDFHPAGADAVWQAYLARRSEAMTVVAVDVESIFNAYSYGLMDPTAIRSYLAAAAAAWGRAPKYVLLVGDASYDYKNYMGTPGNTNRVPTMMFEDAGDSTYMGRYPSDARFADVNGDGYPDSAVGRLPARSYQELAGMLTKIMAYEDQALTGTWYKSGLFVADTWTQTWEQVFEQANTLLQTTYMAPPWSGTHLFFHDAPYNGTDANAFASALRAAWPGAALMHYSGHSAITSLGNQYAFFTSYPSRNCTSGTCSDSDVDLLPPIDLTPSAPSAPLPFVVSSSCYNSAFDEVSTDALMEVLLARADRGTIGSCGFSTIAYPDEEHTFANAFFEQAFGPSKTRPVGPLVDAGRFSLPSSDARSVLGNILMGDPSISLRLPAPDPPPAFAAAAADGAVVLSWGSPAAPVSRFEIYRSGDGGKTWAAVESPGPSDRGYNDGGLVNGVEYTYYATSLDTGGFEGPPSRAATAVPEPGICTVLCQAQAPASGSPGASVPFQASATSTSCAGSLAYDWDFGDGSPHGSILAPTHVYVSAGAYTWTFTASADSASCMKSGTIVVAVPPRVSAVQKAASPFRIIITGTNLHADVAVYVGGQRWATVKIVPETKVVLKGSGLKALFPAGVFVPVRLVNGDGGETTVSYNRTGNQWRQGP